MASSIGNRVTARGNARSCRDSLVAMSGANSCWVVSFSRTRRVQTVGMGRIGGNGWRWVLTGSVVSVASLSGCTSNSMATVPSSPSPGATTSGLSVEHPGRSPSTATVNPMACANVSGMVVATTGVLGVGPFTSDTLGPQPDGSLERKIWVSSQRAGHDDAQLAITDPAGVTVRQTRSGESFVTNAKQFYPGVIRLHGTGPYRIEVTVGPDRICVIADYRVSS